MSDATPRLFTSGLDFPEGPCFDRNGDLCVVNCGNGDITRIAPDGHIIGSLNTGGVPNGAAFAANGDLYVCEAGLHNLLAITPPGEVSVFADVCEGVPMRAPNDLVFDQFGNLYFTDPGGSDAANLTGTVHFATPDGQVSVIDGGMAFPNGLAITAGGERLVVVETCTRSLWTYDILDPGVVDNKALLWQSEDERNLPDGMAYDADGNLYLASYGTGMVDVISPQGETIRQLEAGGLRPTNCAFGGPQFSTLYVTETETNCVYTIEAGAEGLKLFPDRS